jgi:guanine deaminase
MMLDLESLVASFLLSAGSATPFHDLDPLPANRRLSSINETTNANTFVFTSDHLDIVLIVPSPTLLVKFEKIDFQQFDSILPLVIAMALKTVYIGPIIQSKSLTDLDINLHGSIGVDGNGKILFVQRDQSARLDKEWQEADFVYLGENEFFFPGFIGIVLHLSSTRVANRPTNSSPDTHIHASQYPNAGVFGKSTLMDWLETYTFPMESSFRDLQRASRIYNRVVARTLSHGTTTACYYATTHVPATNLLADICQTRGQRAFVGRVCMDQLSPEDYRDETVEAAVEKSQACIDHVKKIDPSFDLITPIITPRFAPSCSAEALKAMGDLHRSTGVPCQTHISENKNEIAMVKELFPSSKSYAHVYDEAGLLTPQMILAHAIHLSAEERALIKQRDAKISHCPASNVAITSGRMKTRELLNEGITVGLGTDVSGGFTSSMLNETREAVLMSRHVAMDDGDEAKLSVEEGLYLATRGGAKVVGLESRIGGFEVGMDWDAQLIRLGSVNEKGDLSSDEGLVDVFGGETWDDKVAKWVYTGDDRNTVAVWVKGRLVHQREEIKSSKGHLGTT